MIRSAVAFHAEEVATRLARVNDAKIDVEACHTYLRMYCEAPGTQEVGNGLLEVAIKTLLRARWHVEVSLLCILQEFAQRRGTGLAAGDVYIVGGDWG
ncbi:MAG TPA: hypothetical protein VHN11_06355, partial [Xanthobacteraceae bacterium]|nr:hypothetical protein [Xanthobacteraceae bacterium]